MPVTRSQSGSRDQQQETSRSETTTTPTDSTATTSGTVTETTEQTVTTQQTQEMEPTVQQAAATEEQPLVPSGPARSKRSKKSTRARRIAQAREEIIRLQLELANARLATLEAESDTDEDTVVSEPQAQRVADWLSNSQAQPPIEAQRHQEPIDREEAAHRIEATTLPNDAVGQAAPPATTDAQPPIVKAAIEGSQKETNIVNIVNRIDDRCTTQPIAAPAGATPAPGGSHIDLKELASAIALAARSSPQTSPRYLNELPVYTGSHREWLIFKAAYRETSAYFTDTENLVRLRRSLKGRAREVVENLLIHSTEPEAVMKTLEVHFGRPHSIALDELARLKSIPPPRDSAREFCIFASKVNNIVASLKALGKASYLSNPEVMKIVSEKLTSAMKYRWYDFEIEQPEEEADLIKLSRFLEREMARCSRHALPEPVTTSDLIAGQMHRRQKTLTTTEQKSDTSTCPVCDTSGHTANGCKKFKEAAVNDRWDIAKGKSLCFRCLRVRKNKHSCKGTTCNIDGCQRSHHRMLHFQKAENSTERQDEAKAEVVSSTWTPSKTRTYLKILPVRVSGPRGDVNAYALLDDGSTVTLVDAEIARRTGARGPVDPLHIEAIAQTEVKAATSRRVTLTLHGSNSTSKIRARTVDNLKLSAQEVNEKDIAGCEHLIDIQDRLKYNRVEPRILIGQDNWHLLLASEVRRGKRHQPVASLTSLGWVLHGANTRSLGQRVHYIHHLVTPEDSMDQQLKHHFAIESLTIEPKRPRNDPEERALAILNECTKEIEDGRYQTALLWKQDDVVMPNSYENALKRLHSTEKKIDRDPQLKQKYEEQMGALIEKGYAERAPTDRDSNRTWYLPHFPVLNVNKPGKVRVVHDAAATNKGVSLNDHLLTGPDLLQSLPGVLMRMRQHQIAVSADIAEMFMQVKVREEDRDALRYLWRGDRRGNQPPDEYRMTSLIFGATSSPATAIFVKNLNAEKHKETHPEAYEAIIKNHYVDDYLQSFRTVEEAIKTSRDVRDVHRHAHFELRQWTSNSTQVLQALGTEEKKHIVDLNDGSKIERVLGLIWRTETDELAFNLNLARLPSDVVNSIEPTKRQLLKIVMSLFDPLGLAAPVTTRAKQILQEVWRRGTSWDQSIDEDLIRQWTEWMGHLQQLKNVAIPRCYFGYSNSDEVQLHIFVDASEAAYAAALYWRVTHPSGQIDTSLVLGKARVAPLKTTSIPRLELQAAVMGSRMAATVIEEHDRKPDSKTFWTDSRTVLTWLKTGARSYRPYVAHRIAAIEEHSSVQEWRWIPTKMNVADDATRDVPRDLSTQHRWFRGPDFLREEPTTWPAEKPIVIESTGEEKNYHIANTESSSSLKNSLPDVTRFSKWEKLIRTTARILQFITLCRRKIASVNYKRTKRNKEKDPDWKRLQHRTTLSRRPLIDSRTKATYRPIDADTLRKAEELIVKLSQQESFPEEIRDLQNNRATSSSSRLRSISVEIVNGAIVLKTRVGEATDVTESMKRPKILDGDHHIAKLYIEYTHRQLHHAGVEMTMNECRQHYWILRLRTMARMIVHRCLPCRIRRNRPPEPPTGNHPRCRLAHHHRPFTYVGVDYFGPLMVTVGRSTQKRYGALFTCLTTRAVHLELAGSLSTDSAVMALRRMIARRGCPTEIWSDNGTNLQGADRELRRSIDAATEEEASKKTISWRYIPPGAPFMGGAWERLIRSVKIALNTALRERHPTEEVLATLLAEVEFTVNSRPLTHVSVDPEDDEALTPNHFVLGGPARVPAPGTFDDRDLIGRTHWRASQRLADLFWSRWLREYLPELQNRREPHGRGPAIGIGDIVLIVDGTLPRNTWPRGIVIATFPGPDGVVRAVDVKTAGGVLRRPAKKLVVLPTARPAPTA